MNPFISLILMMECNESGYLFLSNDLHYFSRHKLIRKISSICPILDTRCMQVKMIRHMLEESNRNSKRHFEINWQNKHKKLTSQHESCEACV